MTSDTGVPGRAAMRDAAAARRRVYVVVGMHRAGTSVVARALQALGVDLGDRLMSADVRMNSRGFFEDLDIVSLDDGLLHAVGADWKNVAPLTDIDWTAAAFGRAFDDACRLLDERLVRTGQFGFKDPRVPRLLPFWQRAFATIDAHDCYVIAVRHPLSVAASLSARDGLDWRRSVWLWISHMTCALHYTRGRSRLVVDYDRLLARPDHELGRMAAELGLPDTEIRRDCVAAFKRDFLADEMRHAHYHSDDLGNAAAVPLAAELHALTQDLASDIENASDAVTSGRIEDLFVRMNAFAPLLSYAGITERVADDVPRLEGELAWARSSLAEATTYNGSLQESLHQKDEAIQVSENYTEDLLASIARKDRELVAAHAEMDATQAKMDATHAKLIEVEGKLQLVAERAWQRLVRKIQGKH